MQKILIATSNPAKLAEIKSYLSDLPIELVSLSNLNIPADAPETGTTFKQNALMKANYYCNKSGLATLADDGGLEIDALDGAPGVNSHRWVNGISEDTDEELINYTLLKLKGVPLVNRKAQLRLVLAFVTPNNLVFTSEAKIRGIIPLTASTYRKTGFPYRSLLFLPEINKYYNHDELTADEIERYNHRRRAIFNLKPVIVKYLVQK
jgi:XTP/dITP diphosphohydrolase